MQFLDFNELNDKKKKREQVQSDVEQLFADEQTKL